MYIFIFIVITHYIADFIFQDEKWAVGKSKSFSSLVQHTTMYSIIWVFPVHIISEDFFKSLVFVLITFIAHTITDYFTSKIVSKRFSDEYYGSPIPNLGAFSIIGFDQVLHYIQLIITWNWLFSFTF